MIFGAVAVASLTMILGAVASYDLLRLRRTSSKLDTAWNPWENLCSGNSATIHEGFTYV